MNAPSTTYPLFVGNDLALDFINTAYGLGGKATEVFADDKSVVSWLGSAGLVAADTIPVPQGLFALAIALREEARHVLAAAQGSQRFVAPVVNTILREGSPVLQLQDGPDNPRLMECRRDDSIESLLEPVAAALARLLCGGDLENVRQCEALDCTLVFHDTTKSRKRRWCSMAQCGNRMKVAAYRSRKQLDEAE